MLSYLSIVLIAYWVTMKVRYKYNKGVDLYHQNQLHNVFQKDVPKLFPLMHNHTYMHVYVSLKIIPSKYYGTRNRSVVGQITSRW